MIPLAQYFAESGNEEFTPFQKVAVRKPATPIRRKPEGLTVLPPKASVRPLAAALQTANGQGLQPSAEPRISLREVEAERARWQAEREAQAVALTKAVAAAREAGTEAGREEARKEMAAQSEERIEAIRQEIANDHGVALVSTRAEWTQEQSDRLADLLILQVAILEETIKLSLNSVLRPLALDARRRQTLDDLVGAVKTIALDGMAYKIAASGPADLLEMLEGRLGDHAKLLSFEPDDTQADIRIAADNTVIETRLSSWRLALEEALS
ncbi:hypothetical protein Sa4125_34740 [Aureimonas sp. SA4125]|uniref:hypothetical protein n=1 Tax=Aureimonas sp. SA4125 TaxID=2826993 RepID=UPI001CC6668C|nr:hypothetical protein [Aureimonas sp. SA4125]BDA85932.1 hypothetical protein Sa4125_34740 [Aureimonas sp. SA4125]